MIYHNGIMVLLVHHRTSILQACIQTISHTVNLSKARASDSSIRGHDQLGNHSNGVSRSPAPQDRDMSSGIISQRRDDRKDGVLTEKYSGLRIKYVFSVTIIYPQ